MSDYQRNLCERALVTIETKKAAYEKLYGAKPQFVKVPDWLPYAINIHISKTKFYDINRYKEKTLCGLKVCPTISIQGIDKIEVF